MASINISAILFIIAVIALIIFGCFRGNLISHEELLRKLDDFFNGRTPLSDDEFFIHYFEAQGIPKEIPIRVRKIFEEHFDADFSRIKSSDDFSEEMRFIWGFDSMIDVEISVEITKEFDLPDDVEFDTVKSLQDIVAMIWKYKQAPCDSVHPEASIDNV